VKENFTDHMRRVSYTRTNDAAQPQQSREQTHSSNKPQVHFIHFTEKIKVSFVTEPCCQSKGVGSRIVPSAQRRTFALGRDSPAQQLAQQMLLGVEKRKQNIMLARRAFEVKQKQEQDRKQMEAEMSLQPDRHQHRCRRKAKQREHHHTGEVQERWEKPPLFVGAADSVAETWRQKKHQETAARQAIFRRSSVVIRAASNKPQAAPQEKAPVLPKSHLEQQRVEQNTYIQAKEAQPRQANCCARAKQAEVDAAFGDVARLLHPPDNPRMHTYTTPKQPPLRYLLANAVPCAP